MILNFYRKVTSTMRYRTKLLIFKNKYNKNKKYIKTFLSKAGRNFSGKLTIYNRKFKTKVKSPMFNFLLPFYSKFFFLRWINIDTKKKKKYNILKTWDNTFFCLPHIRGDTVGLKYKIPNKFLVPFSLLHYGLPCFLNNIPDNYKICHIMDLRKQCPTYSTASGTFSIKIPKKKKDKLCKIILPSKQIKFFLPNNICFVGKNDLSIKKLFKPGKAGYNSNVGFKPTVRGVAMNPVDHPNGGRTKSCTPEKSPWGWVAKLNK